jgi:hypothetical protein
MGAFEFLSLFELACGIAAASPKPSTERAVIIHARFIDSPPEFGLRPVRRTFVPLVPR